MPEPIQTPEQGTEQTEPVTQPENTEETETPKTPTTEKRAETSTEQPATEPPSVEQQPTPPGYVPKDKFVASAQESILNAERVRAANARIESLTKQDTPTDEAMRKLYPEWDNLDDYNKRVLIRQETIAMQQARTLLEQQEIKERQQLEDQLEDVIENSEYASKLKGKEAEFKRFAKNKKNRGIAADVLAKAFLFDAEDKTSSAPTPQPMTEALPTGSGGPRGDLKPKKISLEEARSIRQTDYKRYMELVKSNQIEEDDI